MNKKQNKISLYPVQYLKNWFVIEPYTGTGQPEGTGPEWHAILAAMKERKPCAFRRVGVRFNRAGDAWFWSPRNSARQTAAKIRASDLDEWITRARQVIVTATWDKRGVLTEI